MNRDTPLLWRGRMDYADALAAMQSHNAARTAETPDEIWMLEHAPVFTLGMSGRREHVLDAGAIPVIKSDRGGQVTYHGPGQLVVYLLLNLKRRGLTARPLVALLEQSVIDLLSELHIDAKRRAGAPGVYVDDAKVAALGIRIRRGGCYHGIALNVDMDLSPFKRINPCGYAGLRVTQLADLGAAMDCREAGRRLAPHLARALGLAPEALRLTAPDTELSYNHAAA
jgi:lipoyl(octanoyl) transferase